MRRWLLLKICGLYLLLSILSFFVASSLGRQLVEDARTRSHADHLYRVARDIANGTSRGIFSGENGLEVFTSCAQFLQDTADADILRLDLSGNVLLDTSVSVNSETRALSGFNYASFGPGFYEVGDFYGYYRERRLCVLMPILAGYRPQGYVAATMPFEVIEEEREEVMWGLDVVVTVNLVLSLVFLVFFIFGFERPVQEIVRGARQFAAGNLGHRIEVYTKDELGELSSSLNRMAAELKKSKEYQAAFLSNVSHDLRSPLTSIKGFSEAMIDGTIPPELHAHYLEVIAGEAERLEKLTSQVLSLEKMQSGEATLSLTDFDINALLRATAEVFEGSCRKKKIRIRLLLTGTELPVRADRGKIEQVVYNLLDNAVKFSDKGAAIEMESAVRHGKCFVSVRDEGSGIPSADLPHIWDRFYKGDASRGKDRTGTGLGLSIVKEILTAHGQNITVTSTENTGTEFVFSLTLA